MLHESDRSRAAMRSLAPPLLKAQTQDKVPTERLVQNTALRDHAPCRLAEHFFLWFRRTFGENEFIDTSEMLLILRGAVTLLDHGHAVA
jgi:hypothetical protein